jgi:Protein of unknown function (DUF3618)
MLRSELLEREAEARRLELAQTFDELRSRATPGHMLDQLVDYATESGGADFFRNLRDQTVANPLALGLVGAGLAWLMLSGRDGRRPYGSYFAATRERAGSAMSGARDRVSDAAHAASHVATGAAHGAAHLATDAAHMAAGAAGSIASTVRTARDAALDSASQWRDAAGSAASSLRDTTASTYEHSRSRVGDTTAATTAALGNAASAVYGGVAQSAGWTAEGVRAFASGTAATGRDLAGYAAATSRDFADYARDQPLVLMGLGIAFGAAVGAAFPATETERQLMGEASDGLRERTRAFAAEHYERSRSVAEAVLDDVQNRVREGGSSSLQQQPSSSSSSSPAAPHTSIAPLEEITEIQETTFRPERTGLRDGRN